MDNKRAMELAYDPIYKEQDKETKEKMAEVKFEKAFKDFLDALNAGNVVDQIKEIYWQNITKLFRGCCETLPQLSMKERKRLEESFN